MARLTGPDAADRFCYSLRADDSIGTAAGLPAVVYTDAGGTTLANILTVGGAAISGSAVTVDETSLLPLFQYPDGVATVYISVNGGPVSPVRASIGSGGGGGGSSAWVDITGKPTFAAVATSGAYADLSGKPALATVATTGVYSDLTGRPTIPSTKADIGLGSVDNTSDAAKPVSTATQTALNLKAPLASPTFTGTVAGITAAMVGLGSVDNTADTAKPVSTVQLTALNLKAPLVSPALTGTPTAPTATGGDSSTTIATTAFATGADSARVVGPASSVDNQLALFSGTTGKLAKASAVTLDSNADMAGLRRLTRTLGTDPAVAGLERTDINYAVSTTSSDLDRVYVSSVLTSWRNEVGFLRGTPHAGYKDDAVVRGVARSDLSAQTGGWLELQESTRTYVMYKRDWFGKLWRGNGTAAASQMADVLVLGPVASVPAGTPSGTVIVRTAT